MLLQGDCVYMVGGTGGKSKSNQPMRHSAKGNFNQALSTGDNDIKTTMASNVLFYNKMHLKEFKSIITSPSTSYFMNHHGLGW